MNLRKELEQIEEKVLSPLAAKSAKTRGRQRPEKECPVRTAFQRDRDRIVHAKAFRRLKHKTQVFLSPGGDHYRTRLTHTLEVAQIARTMARALRLNEDLTEAIALGHDLGHTPFGHAGEAVLNELNPAGFRHYEQSLRVVDFLEKEGKGLNLTWEVRDGILKHSKGKGPILPKDKAQLAATLEGQLVRVADIIAYLNHDLDDALRGNVIKESDIPKECLKVLGHRHSERINTMVKSLIFSTLKADDGELHIEETVIEAMDRLRDFLFARVYEAPCVYGEMLKAKKFLKELYFYFLENGLPWEKSSIYDEETSIHQKICDFIAGMTDRYALSLFEKYFVPKPWPF
ncbi:deoxyguanosinetriphosphate triphosphohydrolase [Thermodesulfatator autotrophicus]|uniref:Deoxyguanosinetriphosphate triphosphohydrolase n=1 Tax=Thermodesulfatator autotrophicus TaxID=1795632 RepID=A0A177E8P8_9BACT|nr:deoxyguanosinetriphosphate triphosphohydrolase [Thermodesulfatator autotrophicus]OAG28285.1 deoxyguanosinetriphosphate triphosphohydrolase [Thermodesulfatator autotrophicus]